MRRSYSSFILHPSSFLFLLFLALLCTSGCQRGNSGESGPGTPDAKPEAPPTTARQLLDRMTAAYHAAHSYSDDASGRVRMKSGSQNIDDSYPFSVSIERPNRLAMQSYSAKIACDGQKFRATVKGINQVLVKPAPAQLTTQFLFADPLLADASNRGPFGPALQPVLMLVEHPLKEVLQEFSDQTLLEPATVDGHECYRAALTGDMGTTVFWIDRENYLLRRMELPIEDIRRREKEAGRTVEELSSIIDFRGAQLNAAIPPEKFQLSAPLAAEEVPLLVKANPAQLLGKKTPAFQFLDLDHKPVTPAALKGKVAVIDFWATNCPPCRLTLPKLSAVAQKYKDHPHVAFLAVSIDPPEVPNAALNDVLKQLAVTLPVFRDQEAQVNSLFLVEGIPSLLLVGPTGLIEYFEAGPNADLEKMLPEKIEKLLNGGHLYEEAIKEYQDQLQRIQQAVAAQGEATEGKSSEIPPAKIAEAGKPGRLTLKSLWKCSELQAPGNILVVAGKGDTPRIYVLDNWRTIVELAPDGTIQARHDLEIPKQEVISTLTTAVDGHGNRYFAGWTALQQQVHLFDENWKHIVDFPADALENKHPGISYASLADLTGEGKLLLYVGYWGTVGVQAVSFDGKRVWSNRSLENVLCLALTPPNVQHQRRLMCLDTRGMAVLIDAQGQRKEEVLMGLRPLQLLVGADLDGDGRPQYCGMSQRELGSYVAVGLDPSGKELWTYDLPKGNPQTPIDLVIAGSVTPSRPGQWLLPAADGSIHILAADGKLVDRFNYGSALAGLATAVLKGHPVLLIASPQGVEAMEVK